MVKGVTRTVRLRQDNGQQYVTLPKGFFAVGEEVFISHSTNK